MKELRIRVADQKILNRIYVVRGQKIMIDEDLAEMYWVETKQLKRQVKRNIERFPKDFMFELTKKEFENLRCQIGTSSLPAGKPSWGGTRYMPMAITEQGVAMLLSILDSKSWAEYKSPIIFGTHFYIQYFAF